MLSASSFNAASSKLRRGLVVDSASSASGRLRYSVASVIWVSMMCAPFERLRVKDTERTRRAVPAPQGGGLATNRLVRKGFRNALCAEVPVPQRGEFAVFFVEVADKDVVRSVQIPRILLQPYVVVAPVVGH